VKPDRQQAILTNRNRNKLSFDSSFVMQQEGSPITPGVVPSPGHETPAQREERDKLWKVLDAGTIELLSTHFETEFGVKLNRTSKTGKISRVQSAEGVLFFELALTFVPVLTANNHMDARARSYKRVFQPIFRILPRAYQMLVKIVLVALSCSKSRPQFPRSAETGYLMPNRLGLLALHIGEFKVQQSGVAFACANPIDKIYHALETSIPGVHPIDVLALQIMLRTYAYLRWRREGPTERGDAHAMQIVRLWKAFDKRRKSEASVIKQDQQSIAKPLSEKDGEEEAVIVLVDTNEASEDDDFDDGLSYDFMAN